MLPTEPKYSARSLDAEAAARLLVAADQVDDPSLESGLPKIPGYLVLSRVAEGGQGCVYRAVREGSNCPVAVKVLRWNPPGGSSANRLLRELEIWSRLRIAGMPRLIDYGVTRELTYLVCEWIDGRRLDEWWSRSDHDLRSSIELLGRLADLVQRLHERGLIHRDIKPSNIMVTVDGSLVLIDLGIAVSVTLDDQTMTAEGVPVGTPGFMSPEQARGERESISTRADVFSLGAVGFWLTTGRTPYDTSGSLVSVLKRIGEAPPESIASLRPSMPRPLVAILQKAVSADASCRYASAGELRDDLNRWLAGDPVEAVTPGWTFHARRWARRHPVAVTGTICGVVGLLFLGTSLALRWALLTRPQSLELDDRRRRAVVTSAVGVPVHTWDTELDEGVVFAGKATGIVNGRHSRALVLGLDAAVSVGGLPDISVFEWGHFDRPAWNSRTAPLPSPPGLNETRPWRLACGTIADVFPSLPGDEIIAVHSASGGSATGVRIYDLSGRVLFERWHDGFLSAVRWMPSSAVLVLAGVNSERRLSDIGVHGTQSPYLQVVMGIEPHVDEPRDWIQTPLSSPGSGRPAKWYYLFWPPGLADRFDRIRLGAPFDAGDPGVLVTARLGGTRGDIIWTINPDGTVGPTGANAAYSTTADAPAPSAISLRSDLPDQ